jgi:hypothetical protein
MCEPTCISPLCVGVVRLSCITQERFSFDECSRDTLLPRAIHPPPLTAKEKIHARDFRLCK